MTISAIKNELHRYIDTADEEQLKAMQQLLRTENSSRQYSQEELDKFYSTLQGYTNGTIETISVATGHAGIREHLSRK
jgi:hypothetical protein